MRTMQSTDPRWQHRVQMASVPLSQCLLNGDNSWHSHRPRHSFKLFQWSTWPKITQLQEDHWALIRPATLERPPPVPFSCSARRNCFLSNVQTVPPPRTTSITDTTDNRVRLVGMSLSNLARSDEWKHNVDYGFGNPNMNFRNIGIQVPPPAIWCLSQRRSYLPQW